MHDTCMRSLPSSQTQSHYGPQLCYKGIVDWNIQTTPFSLRMSMEAVCFCCACFLFVCLLQDSILAVFEWDGLPSTPLLSFTNNLSPFLHLDTLLSPLIHIPPYHLLSSVTSFPHTLPFSLHNYAVSLLSMFLYYWLSYTFLQQIKCCSCLSSIILTVSDNKSWINESSTISNICIKRKYLCSSPVIVPVLKTKRTRLKALFNFFLKKAKSWPVSTCVYFTFWRDWEWGYHHCMFDVTSYALQR